MAPPDRIHAIMLFAALGAFSLVDARSAQNPAPPSSASQSLPSDTPESFKPSTDSFDYVRREEMIPMRDGVKLHTVILVPRGAKNAPILFTRRPYDAHTLTDPDNTARTAAHTTAS